LYGKIESKKLAVVVLKNAVFLQLMVFRKRLEFEKEKG
jgi:hypothetical protein